jgi:hypothetical protein
MPEWAVQPPPAWTALGTPAGLPVSPEARVAGAIPYAGHLDLFVIASDGIAYTIGKTSGGGWDSWHKPAEGEQGFVATASSSPAVVHRVNRQIELFAQGEDRTFFRTWWS